MLHYRISDEHLTIILTGMDEEGREWDDAEVSIPLRELASALRAALAKREGEYVGVNRVRELEAALRLALSTMEAMLSNDPNDLISDAGHTCLDGWHHDIERVRSVIAKREGE